MSSGTGPKAPEDRVGTASFDLRSPDLFQVGRHAVRVSQVKDGRWVFAVDGGTVSQTFPTRADAWAAGVRAAYRGDDA